MQAIVLAAGMGTRIKALSDDMPKSMLEINGKPILLHIVDMLDAVPEISQIQVVTGYRSRVIEASVSNYRKVSTVYNPFYSYCNVMGSFWFGSSLLKEEFIFVHGDTIFEKSILSDLVASRSCCSLVVDFGEVDEEAMKVRLDDGALAQINKKIPCDDADGEFIGLAKFSVDALVYIQKYTLEEMQRGNLKNYFEDVLERMIEADAIGSLDIIPTAGRFWREIDFEDDYDFAVKNARSL